MAIIHCPNCSQRISSQLAVCPHCDFALAEISPEEQERMKKRRYKRLLYRAVNLSYLGLTLLVIGAIWWWFYGPEGWVMPPPLGGISLVLVGSALYVVARSWIFWLRLGRRRGRP